MQVSKLHRRKNLRKHRSQQARIRAIERGEVNLGARKPKRYAR